MHSCIYRGTVRHRRFERLSRAFRYPIRFLYVDLDELPQIAARLPCLSLRRYSVASVCREDHLGDPNVDLATAVRQRVADELGQHPDGAVRLLTLWRSFGFYFSPVNFFFLFDQREQLQAVVAEVTNTPWREQHCYVLSALNETAPGRRGFRHSKQFHVSPFLELDLEYRWQLIQPGESLSIHLEACRGDQCQLDATLTLQRTELTTAAWLATLARYPLVPARVLTGIYWEALRLWLNKAPYYPHPKSVYRTGLPTRASRLQRPTRGPARTADWLTRRAKRLLHRRLQRLSWGQLEVVDGADHDHFGRVQDEQPLVELRVLHPQFYRQVIFGGDLGAAESYLSGQWQTDDLVPLFRLLIRNQSTLQEVSRGVAWLIRPATTVQRWLTRNTPMGSRKNIHAHYDLGNAFFALFLDETMTYSSGFFPHARRLAEGGVDRKI